MQQFPDAIIQSMRQGGVMTTCVPVEFDGADWQTAVFFELGGKECERDRQIMAAQNDTLPISLEADLIECTTAAVVMLRFEIITDKDNPLAGEVLLAPGLGAVQFDTLEHLTSQPLLRFYFSDENYQVIYSQQLKLSAREHQGYRGILDDAVSHDALIRLTGRYNAETAMKEVTSHYATHVSAG